MTMNRWVPIGVITLLAATGCASSATKPDTSADARQAIAAAIADPRRPAADVARDADRQPQALLEFAGLAPGMSLLDLYAGGGYYTELAAYAVGPAGRVVAYNNTGYARVAAKAIAERYADGRLAGVEQITTENNAVALPGDAFDVALFVLAYHDVYYLDGERGWERIDRPRMLGELFQAMRSGGSVIVVDHVARPGMPAEQVRALHRIDPALIRADFEQAGFRYAGEADFLRNPGDDFDIIAMAPTVRGKTDRAVLRFTKP